MVLFPLDQFPLDLDHLLLQKLNKPRMLPILFLLLWVEWSLLLLILLLLLLLQLPLLLGEDVIHILILKLELIELLNAVLDDGFQILDAAVELVVDGDLIDLLLSEFDHEGGVLVGSLIVERDRVEVDSLVEDHVADFSLGLANEVAQLVVVHEEELELDAIVLHELEVVVPVGALFATHPQYRTVPPDSKSVLHQDEAIPREDLRVFLLADEGHGRNGHEGVGECVVYYEVLDVAGSRASLHLPLLQLLHRCEEHLRTHLLRVLGAPLEGLHSQDQLPHWLSVPLEGGFDVVAIEIGEVGEVDFRLQYLVEIGIIQIAMLLEDLDEEEVGVTRVDVGEGFVEKQLILAHESSCLPRDEFLLADLDSVASRLALQLLLGSVFEGESRGEEIADGLDLLDDEFKRHGYQTYCMMQPIAAGGAVQAEWREIRANGSTIMRCG